MSSRILVSGFAVLLLSTYATGAQAANSTSIKQTGQGPFYAGVTQKDGDKNVTVGVQNGVTTKPYATAHLRTVAIQKGNANTAHFSQHGPLAFVQIQAHNLKLMTTASSRWPWAAG